jgi:DNA-binding GntR family transcriptional regulator
VKTPAEPNSGAETPAEAPHGAKGNRASDLAFGRIKGWIIGGEIPPNSLIDERQMAHRLGTSRTPVREALLRLQSEGLVAIARGKGIRVLALSSGDLREIFQVVTGLEVVAAYLLASRRPERAELAPLELAVTAMEEALKAKDEGAWGEADERFHRGLLELCGNRRLLQVGCQLRDAAQRAHVVGVRLQAEEYRAVSTAKHRQLLTSIAKGDVAAVWDNHFQQRLRGEDSLVGIIERYRLRNL